MSNRTPFRLPSTLSSVNGVVHFAGIDEEFLNAIRDLPVSQDDVFIASFPKSGTTWVCELVCEIHNEGKIDKRNMDSRVPFLEFRKFQGDFKTKEDLHDFYLNHPLPRILKTHLHYDQLPMRDTNKPKYIYVVRNPKDAAVSFYHHYKGLDMYEFQDRTWDEFFELFMDNKVHYGSWFDHVLGWWSHRDDANVLVLKYEDMIKDLPCAVQQIARFVGKDLSTEITQRIFEQTTFKAMSGDQERFGDEEWPAFLFIRKGKVGNWKDYFTEEQNKRFDEMYEKKMAGSALKLEFEL